MNKPNAIPTPAHQTVMEDFVFGGIEADENRLLETERSRWRGIRHEYRQEPLHPRPNEPVVLTVTVGQGVHVDRLAAYVNTDGTNPDGERGTASNGFAVSFEQGDPLWQPLIWDYVDVWQATLPPQPEGTLVHYHVEGWHRGSDESHWCREINLDRSKETPTLYGYHVDQWETPDWAREAVIYQIFVDRFAKGERGEAVSEAWLTVDEMNTFMGGDLKGITARLDYIADLGVNAIWLTPIFTAHAYHAYDTLDYYQIDPRFGTKADLRELIAQAHQRNIQVILDFVANHTSSRSEIFQKALNDPASAERGWFRFDPSYKHGYRTFFDVAAMPQFDLDSPGARAYLCEAAQYWIREFDIDGYRLDYAAGPSHSFWSAFRAACKSVKPECWLVGEVTRTGDLLRSYTGRLDGCLDFGFTRTVRQLCSMNTLPIKEAAAYFERTQRFFPQEFVRPAFLDNHDMNRFLWTVGNDKRRLAFGLTLLMALGQTPILYYGTEVGLSQPRSKGSHREESRHAMSWGPDQDPEMLALTQRLIQIRHDHPALISGQLITHFLEKGGKLWLASRSHGSDKVWLAINAGDRSATIPLPGETLRDLVSGETMNGRCEIEGRTARLLGREERDEAIKRLGD